MKTAEVDRCGSASRADADIARDVETGLGYLSGVTGVSDKLTIEAHWDEPLRSEAAR